MDIKNKFLTLENIYHHIDGYVMLVNNDVAVLNANFYDAEELKKEGIVYRIGEILKCKNALESGGCGLHNNCKFCAIRNVVTRTFKNKKGFKKIESHIRFLIPEKRSEDFYSQISTSYVEIQGMARVVLTVNNVTDLVKLYNISPRVDHCQNNVNPDMALPPAFSAMIAQEKKNK